MSFPCPHCGSQETFEDRTEEEFKPIVPVEIQGTFDKPPPPLTSGRPRFASPTSSPRPATPIATPRTPTSRQQDTSYRDLVIDTSKSSSKTTVPARPLPTEGFNTDRLIEIEASVKAMEANIATLIKSQKVIEKILTNINKELLKLRNK
ncbi:MAG: hypothetical protein EAX86_06085 [Candidatus Heimdallarchaeota archaeon]|nr:hypothetical protein [Candidatus Heimdallarchaeota archaeon]